MKYYVDLTISYPKEITVYADSHDEAEEKALEIAESFKNVRDFYVNDIRSENGY